MESCAVGGSAVGHRVAFIGSRRGSSGTTAPIQQKRQEAAYNKCNAVVAPDYQPGNCILLRNTAPRANKLLQAQWTGPTTKYLHEAAVTRICAIGGFFVSIPVFLTGIILYTFLHFDSTPAIITSVVIGLAIVFCAGAVFHNVFLWRKESKANRTNASADGCDSECDKNYPMSPILKRVIDANHQHHRKCGTKSLKGSSIVQPPQKSFVDLPAATLDLSAGTGLGNGKIPSSSFRHNSTANKSALELSTLV